MPAKKTEPIVYHVGQGKTPWREAILSIPIGATDEQVSAISETVSRLDAAFPVPKTTGIGTWYHNEFVSAYLAIGKGTRLQEMLVVMGDKGVANPGEVLLAWGNKYPTLTVAEVDAKDAPYLNWITTQDGLDAYRIAYAAHAYRLLKEKNAKNEKANEQAKNETSA